MKNMMIKLGLLGLFCFAPQALSAQDKFVTLDKVSIENNSIVMSLSGTAKYHAFKISNPPRLIVEFSNTEHNWKRVPFKRPTSG